MTALQGIATGQVTGLMTRKAFAAASMNLDALQDGVKRLRRLRFTLASTGQVTGHMRVIMCGPLKSSTAARAVTNTLSLAMIASPTLNIGG